MLPVMTVTGRSGTPRQGGGGGVVDEDEPAGLRWLGLAQSRSSRGSSGPVGREERPGVDREPDLLVVVEVRTPSGSRRRQRRALPRPAGVTFAMDAGRTSRSVRAAKSWRAASGCATRAAADRPRPPAQRGDAARPDRGGGARGGRRPRRPRPARRRPGAGVAHVASVVHQEVGGGVAVRVGGEAVAHVQQHVRELLPRRWRPPRARQPRQPGRRRAGSRRPPACPAFHHGRADPAGYPVTALTRATPATRAPGHRTSTGRRGPGRPMMQPTLRRFSILPAGIRT